MKMDQDTIVNLLLMGICFLFLTLMIVVRTIANKKYATMSSYISLKRKNRMSYKKAFKLWIILQCVCFLALDLPKHLYLAICVPILIIYLLFSVYYSDIYQNPEEIGEIDKEEYEKYKKAFIRDRKLRKLL